MARFVVQLRRKNLPKTALSDKTKETLGNKFRDDAASSASISDASDASDAATRRDQEMSERTIHLGECGRVEIHIYIKWFGGEGVHLKHTHHIGDSLGALACIHVVLCIHPPVIDDIDRICTNLIYNPIYIYSHM